MHTISYHFRTVYKLFFAEWLVQFSYDAASKTLHRILSRFPLEWKKSQFRIAAEYALAFVSFPHIIVEMVMLALLQLLLWGLLSRAEHCKLRGSQNHSPLAATFAASLPRNWTGLLYIENPILGPWPFRMRLIKSDFARWDEGGLGMNLGELPVWTYGLLCL